MQTFIFFGIVGSGKGTQAKLLKEYLEKKSGLLCVATSTGDEYRKLVESGGYTGEIVRDTLTRGHLQPNFLTNALFTNILISALTPERHLIADGYPRTVNQSETFEQMMKFYGRSDVKVVFIELSEDEAVKRNLKRGRHDDTAEGLRKRFEEYKQNVIPAMNYFKGREGYEIYKVNGEQSIEGVHKEIIEALRF